MRCRGEARRGQCPAFRLSRRLPISPRRLPEASQGRNRPRLACYHHVATLHHAIGKVVGRPAAGQPVNYGRAGVSTRREGQSKLPGGNLTFFVAPTVHFSPPGFAQNEQVSGPTALAFASVSLPWSWLGWDRRPGPASSCLEVSSKQTTGRWGPPVSAMGRTYPLSMSRGWLWLCAQLGLPQPKLREGLW